MDIFWKVISWVAIFVVSVSYWFQVYRIQKHKEVRDLSMAFYVLFFVGVSLLCIQAYRENSVIFFTKQILVMIPVAIIICQIIYHRQDTWLDEHCESCVSCGAGMESTWDCCPHCGCDQTAGDVMRIFKQCRKVKDVDAIEHALRTSSY